MLVAKKKLISIIFFNMLEMEKYLKKYQHLREIINNTFMNIYRLRVYKFSWYNLEPTY